MPGADGSPGSSTRPPVEFRPTRRLERSHHVARLLVAANRVALAFPELSGTVRLDLLASSSRYRGLTFVTERPPRVAVRPHTRTPVALHATLAHEFVHLLQHPLGPLPGGERSCDLFALARVGRVFPHPPAYLRLPREVARTWERWAELAESLARESIEARGRGERRYIVGWERRLREEARRRERKPRSEGPQGRDGRIGTPGGAPGSPPIEPDTPPLGAGALSRTSPAEGAAGDQYKYPAGG